MGDVKVNQEIEGDAKQLLHVEDKIRDEEEVSTHKINVRANRGQDLLLQDLKRDPHTEQELPQHPSSAPPFEGDEPDHQLLPAANLMNTRHSSHTPPTIHVQDTNSDTMSSRS